VDISLRSALAGALSDLRRTWPQLLIVDLLARLFAVTILTPLVGLLIKLFLATTATGVVADQAIVSFLLHPIGVAALVVVSAVSLSILFVETGQLMVIGFGAVEDRRVSWLDALFYAFRRALPLARLAGSAVVRLLALALPFVAAVAVVYGLFLRAHDINYYLADKPPEFKGAIVAAGFIVTVMALVMIYKIAGWLLSMPMVLFEDMGGRPALHGSELATKAVRRKLTVWIVALLVAAFLLAMAVTSLVGLAANLLVPRDGSNLTLLLVVLSGLLVISGLANLAVSFFTTALFSLLVARVYRSLAGPGALLPEIVPRGTLGPKASCRISGKALLAAGVGVLLVVLAVSYLTLGDRRFEDDIQIIAHRGGSAVAPENTMAAFRRGIDDGAVWLEMDVQEDADGTVVIQHDSDFMRVAGADLTVWNATAAELIDLDVGSFFAPEFSDQRVPKLRDVLELARGNAGLFIELKYYGHDVRLEQKVVDLVEEAGMASEIVIMSLEYDGVQKTASLRPDWTYGLLSAVAIGDLSRLDVDFLALTSRAASLSTIRHTHQQDKKIFVWTVDDPVQMWSMMSRGVDGIITNRVELAQHVMTLRAHMTPIGRFIIWMAAESGLLSGMEHSSERGDA